MALCYGDLLIGGAVLRHLELDLQGDEPQPGSADRVLSGRLSVSPAQTDLLQCGRRYRLHLEDGRAGCVVVSRLVAAQGPAPVVEFAPLVADAGG